MAKWINTGLEAERFVASMLRELGIKYVMVPEPVGLGDGIVEPHQVDRNGIDGIAVDTYWHKGLTAFQVKSTWKALMTDFLTKDYIVAKYNNNVDIIVVRESWSQYLGNKEFIILLDRMRTTMNCLILDIDTLVDLIRSGELRINVKYKRPDLYKAMWSLVAKEYVEYKSAVWERGRENSHLNHVVINDLPKGGENG